VIIIKKKSNPTKTIRVYYFVFKTTVLRSYQELTRTVKCNLQNEEQDTIVNALFDSTIRRKRILHNLNKHHLL